MDNQQPDSMQLATMVFDLLDRASTSSTYKYAVLMGLIDCCQSEVDEHGHAPSMISTRRLARKVLEIYWAQARPYQLTGSILRQNSSGQTKILNHIQGFRERFPRRTSTFSAEQTNRVAFTKLLNDVEWSLIEMPLPRLQCLGALDHNFLYNISWTRDIRKGSDGVSTYLQNFIIEYPKHTDFDAQIRLQPGVGEFLLRMGPLLRPLIQREWSKTVAGFNKLPSKALEDFLFAPERQALTKLVEPLSDVQEGKCFYCTGKLRGSPEVDHFIPWSRSPNDGLQNFVLAHGSCNGSKSNYLADVTHLERWVTRNDPDHSPRFRDVSESLDWLSNPAETMSIARSLYLALPEEMPLWLKSKTFQPARSEQLRTILT